jgi:hypothetical protein
MKTNLSESIHQVDIGATSKQLGTKRFKFITKPSQKVVGPMKLKYSCLISAGLIGGRGQLGPRVSSWRQTTES